MGDVRLHGRRKQLLDFFNEKYIGRLLLWEYGKRRAIAMVVRFRAQRLSRCEVSHLFIAEFLVYERVIPKLITRAPVDFLCWLEDHIRALKEL